LKAHVVAKVAEGKGDFGYNAKTDEYVDMLKAGIIDPTKVTCCIRKCCISCRNDFNH
jgi:chaperonin GroEL (HSP60 family)